MAKTPNLTSDQSLKMIIKKGYFARRATILLQLFKEGEGTGMEQGGCNFQSPPSHPEPTLLIPYQCSIYK